MDHFREVKNSLIWHNEGKFEVVIVNGIITKLNFCEPGTSTGKDSKDVGKYLTSTNFKFLQAVHACLGDLFAFMDEENKKMGYSYAHEDEIMPYHQDEIIEGTYPMTAETKFRTLFNFTHKQELIDPSTENKNIRDIG